MSQKSPSSDPRPPDRSQTLYTPADAAQLLKVGRTTLYAIMRRGELAFIQVGRLRRITPEAIQIYLDQHPQER